MAVTTLVAPLSSVLRSYSQVLFSQSAAVALLLLLATLVVPLSAAFGLGAVLLATVVARAMQLDRELIERGVYGYNALLVGLGAAMLLPPTPAGLVLAGVAVALSVVVTAAAHAALGNTFALPALTVPFLVVFYLVLAAAPVLGVPLNTVVDDGGASPWLPAVVDGYLRSLGAVFFVPRADAGALVLAALVVSSRIAVVLSAVGYALAVALLGQIGGAAAHPLLSVAVGYNFVFVALALGGIWFVPGPASFLLAASGAVACGLVTSGLLPLMSAQGLPLLILPFNLTVFLVLYAMRQRVRDQHPKAVDFLPGSPEENLSYFRTRLARFGARYAVSLRAPFMGRWTCTQGVDGQPTHQGVWRHAFDFEVHGEDGHPYRTRGRSLDDYRCYKLPVLAPADGVVVRVVDGVPDNPVGQLNLTENWGNLVLVRHAPGLHTLLCHLSPGSLAVAEGATVRRGDTLGLCGNSGRSARPHLHVHLQATARVGAPTIQAELHEVVRAQGARDVLHGTLVPVEGDVVRGPEPDPDFGRLFDLEVGRPLVFAVDGGGQQERLVPDVDVWGRQTLCTEDGRARLFYERRDDLFTVHDVFAPSGSCLHLLRAAVGRVPFDGSDRLTWTDHLPVRPFTPAPLRPVLDLASPFLPGGGLAVDYAATRTRSGLVVRGRSRAVGRDGEPLVTTEATLLRGVGIHDVAVTVRGRRRAVHRVSAEAPRRAPATAAITLEDIPLGGTS